MPKKVKVAVKEDGAVITVDDLDIEVTTKPREAILQVDTLSVGEAEEPSIPQKNQFR